MHILGWMSGAVSKRTHNAVSRCGEHAATNCVMSLADRHVLLERWIFPWCMFRRMLALLCPTTVHISRGGVDILLIERHFLSGVSGRQCQLHDAGATSPVPFVAAEAICAWRFRSRSAQELYTSTTLAVRCLDFCAYHRIRYE